MSQAGIVDIESAHPEIPTLFVTDSGDAVAIANTIEILGGTNVDTSASGNTIIITATGVAETLTGNTGGPISPVGGNINTFGSGSITITGAGDTLTTQLTGLNDHSVLIGSSSTDTITNLIVATNGEVLIGSTGGDPVFAHLTSAGGTITFISSPGGLNLEAGSSVPTTFSANSGSAAPAANNLNILGTTTAAGTAPLVTSGAGSTITITAQRSQAIAATDATKVGLSNFDSGSFTVDANGFVTFTQILVDLHVAKWIVNPSGTSAGGNKTTIAAALTAASSGDTIFITPGTYTENLTLKAGVNLTAFNCDATDRFSTDSTNVIINGTCTATFAGTCSISGVCLQTNSAPCLTVSGASATNVTLSQCLINATNNNAISITSSGGGNVTLLQCNGDISGAGIHYFDVSGAGSSIFFFDGVYYNSAGSVSPSTASSSASLNMSYVVFLNHITTSGTGTSNIRNCHFSPNGNLGCTFGASGSNLIFYTRFEGGTATALNVGVGATVTADYLSIDSTNTNALDGTGTIKYGEIVFTNSSSKNNVTTKTALPVQSVTSAISQLVYSTTNNDLAGLATANSASLVTSSTGVPVWSSTMTNGQMIIGSTGATPAAGTITSTGGSVTVSTGAGTLNLEVASGTAVVKTLTGDSGGALSPTAGNINILGGPGVTVSGSGSTLTVNSVVFTDTTAATLVVDNGYFATAAGTYALPATAAQGELIEIVCDTAGAVVLDAPALNFIRIGANITSSGGTMTSNAIGDSVRLRYRLATLTWEAVGVIGTWTPA